MLTQYQTLWTSSEADPSGEPAAAGEVAEKTAEAPASTEEAKASE